jgi:nickel transport protein
MIHSESFSGDKKVKDGLIKVYDISGNLLLEGRTDADGNFTFKDPKRSDLKIVLEAGMGHRAEYVFEKEEVEQTSDLRSSVKPSESDIHKTLIEGLSKEDIKKIMEEVIDEKMSGISRRLARIEEDNNPGLTEIIGGIGYIIGIMGIVLYFKNRKS